MTIRSSTSTGNLGSERGVPPLAQIIALMREAHGRDLALFDEAFLAKSLQRRLAGAGLAGWPAYLDRLAQDSTEAQALLVSLNIGYSEFFREPLSFALLEQVILPGLMQQSGQAGLRVLVGGLRRRAGSLVDRHPARRAERRTRAAGKARDELLAAVQKIDDFARNKADALYATSEEVSAALNRQLILMVAAIVLLSLAIARLAVKIDDAARHLLDMINGLIEYTRDAGVAAAAPFNLATLLADASREPFSAALKKGLRTQIHCDPALPASFIGDAQRIRFQSGVN